MTLCFYDERFDLVIPHNADRKEKQEVPVTYEQKMKILVRKQIMFYFDIQ